ncbi:MAG: septal ring lytic transglycosylase RlpA family protein [Treponema sp.]|nr:septal ring lytic transglycosylase RlpA family protein [Treponema sp.]
MKKIFLIAATILLFSTAIVAQNLQVYKKNVTASFYAEAFHGKPTSNGEVFNMNDFTCAHKSLPFDTILKVTNLQNGKSVKVRVNDRGPFVVDREIDLSKAAAIKLDMITSGTTKVKLEIVKLGENTKLSQQTAKKAEEIMASKQAKIQVQESKDNAKWDIQLGAFSSKENATTLAKKLSKDGFSNIVFQKTSNIIRVAIKEVDSKSLPEIEKKLKEKGYTEYTVRKRK